MNKILKYCLITLSVFVVLFFSFDVQRLDSYKISTSSVKAFNAEDYIENFLNNEIRDVIALAPKTTDFFDLLKRNPQKAFEEKGLQLGISKTLYFFTKDEGLISDIQPEYIVVTLGNNEGVKLATDFIFGNAVRDGSGKIDINQFVNMTDFNNVSLALNNYVKNDIVAPLKRNAQIGKSIEFAGAFEVNASQIELSTVRIIPVYIKLSEADAN